MICFFTAAEMNSLRIIKPVLAEFEDLSSLKANPAKSTFFCTGVNSEDKKDMVELLQMFEGSLPDRYLGVPLITKRLSAADCEVRPYY